MLKGPSESEKPQEGHCGSNGMKKKGKPRRERKETG